MSITLNAGKNNTVTLGADGDLAKALTPGIDAIFHLSDKLKEIVGWTDMRLASVPAGTITDAFCTDRATTWDLTNAANLTLSLKPEAGGSIRFTKPGPLLTCLGADGKPFPIDVPAGYVGVTLGFSFSLSAGGKFAYSSGKFGVKANLTNKDQFLVANHRFFPQDTGIFAAVRQAFEEFRLPFLPANVTSLPAGQLLEFEFLGNLNLGCGLTYGLTTQLGGATASEITASVGHGFATALFKAAPTFKAGAQFGITYQHEDAYRYVIAPQGPDAISLTILRKEQDTLATKGTVGITLDPGLSFDFASKAGEALGAAVGHVCDNLAGGIGGQAGNKLKAKLQAASVDTVNKLTSVINDRVNGLLKTPNGTTELQLLHERVTTDTALFQLIFTKGISDAAVRLALQGDIAAAVRQPGVTIEPGSLIEHSFIKRATIGLQVFDLCKWHDVLEYIDKTTITYAGNGTLRLAGIEGITHTSGFIGHDSLCDVHFLAETTGSTTSDAVTPVAVNLHFVLVDRRKQRAAKTARLLAALNNPALQPVIADACNAVGDGETTLTTSCVFPQASFRFLQANPYQGGKPNPLHEHDAHNYDAFAQAVRQVEGDFLGFPTWDGWAEYNVVANDQEGSTMIPSRHDSGNPNGWPNKYIGIPDTRRTFMRIYSEAGRDFMNLVEALQGLAQPANVDTEEAYKLFLKSLKGILRDDIPVDFIKATLLALITLAGNRLTGIAATTGGTTRDITFEIATAAAA
jgi:hypothetical protein